MRRLNKCGHSTDETNYKLKKKNIQILHFTDNTLKMRHIIIDKWGQEPLWA